MSLTQMQIFHDPYIFFFFLPGTIAGSPAVLHIPILQPCMISEELLITVDTHSGHFLAHVPQFGKYKRIIFPLHLFIYFHFHVFALI